MKSIRSKENLILVILMISLLVLFEVWALSMYGRCLERVCLNCGW